jgi:hypothetical protein
MNFEEDAKNLRETSSLASSIAEAIICINVG